MSISSLYLKSLFLSMLLILTMPASAQLNMDDQGIKPLDNSELTMSKRQRDEIQKLVRENFGPIQLKGDTSELYLLQKLLDKQLIDKDDTFGLQAVGVVLGDIMAKNLYLNWVSFEDQYGKSRALQYKETDHLLYPVTMISRRYQNDLPCDINQLYQDAKDWASQRQRELY